MSLWKVLSIEFYKSSPFVLDRVRSPAAVKSCIDLLFDSIGIFFFHCWIGRSTGSETWLKHDVNCIQNVSIRRLSLVRQQFSLTTTV